MKIPQRNLGDWAREIVDECTTSRPDRMSRYKKWTDIYYTGSDNDIPSKRNRCYSHVDKLSSYLFSPSEVEYDIDFDDANTDAWRSLVEKGQNYLNRGIARAGSDVVFGYTNEWSLVKGSAFAKLTWSAGGFQPWSIQPEFFGVLREDIEELDRQDAFTQTFFLTPTQFRRMLGDRRDKAEIMRLMEGRNSASADAMIDSSRRDLQTGGGFPMAAITVPGVTSPSNPQFYGTVDWTTAQAGPHLDPRVRGELIEVNDLWVWDDDRDDWTTIRIAERDVVLEGADIHRNLSDCGKGRHPFVKVCSNRAPGYFWGRSEIANIWPNQKMLTSRLNNIDQIFNMQARPSRMVIGSPGINDEKMRVLLTAGGTLSDPNPMTKVETFKPEMPQGALEYLMYLDDSFDEAAGVTKVLQGEPQPGVRAGVQANTLLRTSTPRLRDRALIVEKQAAAWGDLHLKMLRVKDATLLTTANDGRRFTFGQFPDDASVVVDSHTSSPAFSGDNQQLMFALAKSGAVGPKELIEGTHPPRRERLLAALERQEQSQAAMMEELKKTDPELWAKALTGRQRR